MKYGSNGILAVFSLCVFFAAETALAQVSYFSGWSAYAGGAYYSDDVYAVAVDAQNNSYFGGSAWGELQNNNNPFLEAARPYQAGRDGLLAKVRYDGTLAWYLWLRAGDDDIDGVEDRISAVAAHTNGSVYAAGFSTHIGNSGTSATLFLVDDGQTNVTQTLAFGSFNSEGTNGFTAVAVDSNGYLYAAGYTTVTNLPAPVAGSAYKGGLDACVVKVSPAGSVVWTCYLGGTNADTAAALALAPDGSVYVGGQTRSPGWTTVPTATTGPSTPDGFVAKLSPAGATVWSACLGGSASNAVTALARAPSSSALYLGGATTSSGFFSGASRLNSYVGGEEGFVVSFADLGSAFQTNWCRFFGSNGADRVTALALPTNGFVAVGGTTSSGHWLPQSGASAFSGVRDGFISVLGSDGSVSWSSYVGGTNRDNVAALACRSDRLVAAGSTFSPASAGWISGGFWTDWTKDPGYNIPPVPDYSANLSYGFVSTWTAEPGVAPSVTGQSGDLTVSEGAPAVFSVTAAGTAPLAYRWFRNGAPLAGAASNVYTLASAAPTNSGDVYCCQVSNFYGVAVSSNATLTVIAKGSLSVTLSPAQAVAQGAKWSLDGGASWLASGEATNLPPGAYAVSFTNLTGWIAPAALGGVQVLSGAATATSGVYTAVLPSASRVITGTNVTVTVRAPAGLSAWTLVETLPAGLTPATITGGGVWNSGARTLTFSGPEAITNVYSYTALCSTSGLYTVSGTVTPQPAGVPVAVTGDSQILKANLIRTISGNSVTITVYQPSSSFIWSVYEYLPAGLTATNITGPNFTWDADTSTIDWYRKGVGQTLTYQVLGAPGSYTLSGEGQVTASGMEPVFGDSVVTLSGGAAVPAPDIIGFAPAGAGTWTLTFTSVVNQAYAILTNATLSATNAWSVYLAPVTGEAGVTQREVPMAGPCLFYRVRVQP